MTYLEKIKDIYNYVADGKALDAFEKYYAEDVVMVLEDGTEVEGKDTNRDRENEFFSNVESFNGITVTAITSNEEEGTTSVECAMDITFKGDNQMVIEQVAVQHWEDDEVKRERFYGTQSS